MANRRQWHLSTVTALVGAALLVACGGGGSDEKLDVGKVVSFGDSLSDLGTYAVAASISGTGAPPFFAGRFTTNTHTGYTAASNTNTAAIWVEWVAARVGVPITQAMLGFATTRIPCPAAATPGLAQSCTAYGQGGSRITNPAGVNNSAGALTDPLVTQVAAHLARFTSFSGNDIVFVFAGGNDLLVNLAAVQRGLATPQVAVAAMQQAGTELATLIREQIAGKGAKRVALLTLPDAYVTQSPLFSPADANTKALITQMLGAFNAAALTAVDGGAVRAIDNQPFFTDLLARPSAYNITNVTTAACDPAKITAVTRGRITDGSALFCNGASAQLFTAAGVPNLNTLGTNANATWLYADGLHPTTGGHKALADYVIGQIKEFGWIPLNL